MWENTPKNYSNIKNSDYLVLVTQWNYFDLQHQHKKPGMAAYTENVSFGGWGEGRGRQIPLLSCLVDKSQVIVKGSLSKEQGCLLIKKEVCCVGSRSPIMVDLQKLGSDFPFHCDQRTEQGPGFLLQNPKSTQQGLDVLHQWPENTARPISPSPVTREHSRDQVSRSTDPENQGPGFLPHQPQRMPRIPRLQRQMAPIFLSATQHQGGPEGSEFTFQPSTAVPALHPITILLIRCFLLFDFCLSIYLMMVLLFSV